MFSAARMTRSERPCATPDQECGSQHTNAGREESKSLLSEFIKIEKNCFKQFQEVQQSFSILSFKTTQIQC